MVYITPDEVRALTNNTLTDVKMDDEILEEIILQATAKVNSEINVNVREEKVIYIDTWRKNPIHDGTTTTFYIQNGVTNYISDSDDDGDVTITDVRTYKLSSDGVRTELTVSAVDVEDGSFTVSAAPGTDTREMTVSYSYSWYNVDTPDKLISLLTGYLTASWAYLAIDHGLGNNIRFGNISISKPQISMPTTQYWNRYQELLGRVQVPTNKSRVRLSKQLI